WGLQIALAVGLLAKGMLGIVLPAIPIATLVVLERRWGMVRELARPRRWVLLVAILLPWHAIVALRHSGFAFDYLVNQHLLFFLDRKEPRDSIPISLAAFWGAFALRAIPWTALAPVALAHAMTRARDARHGSAHAYVVAWAFGTLLLFSAATSRLE